MDIIVISKKQASIATTIDITPSALLISADKDGKPNKSLIAPPRMVCARQPHCLGSIYSLCPRPFPQNNDFPLDLLP